MAITRITTGENSFGTVHWAGTRNYTDTGTYSGLQTNDLKIFVAFTDVSSTMTPVTSGWTKLWQCSAGNCSIALFYKFHASGDPAFTFSVTADQCALVYFHATLRGVNLNIPFMDTSNTIYMSNYQDNIPVGGYYTDESPFVLAIGMRNHSCSGSPSLTIGGATWSVLRSVAYSELSAVIMYHDFSSPTSWWTSSIITWPDGTVHETLSLYQGLIEAGHSWIVSGSTFGPGVLNGPFSLRRSFSGSMTGASVLDGPIAAIHPVAGSSFALSGMSGPLNCLGTFEGPLAGESFCEGSIVPHVVLEGEAVSGSSISGGVDVNKFFQERLLSVSAERRTIIMEDEEREYKRQSEDRVIYVPEEDVEEPWRSLV